MNSFIGWIGGKKLLRKEIIARFPEEYGRYVEVFGGAGWVLFGLDPKPGRMEVYNDANGELVNLFRCVKYYADAVQQELDWMLQSRETFMQYLNQRGETDIQRAARYFYQIKESFGCDTRTFATAPKPLINATEYLTKVRERLQHVVIENLDFERLLVNVKSTCISKMPSQRTFSETANSYLHLLGLTFRGSIPWQQLAKFFWLSKI